MLAPPSAAACSSPDRTRRACATQYSRSRVAAADGAEHVLGPCVRRRRVLAADDGVEVTVEAMPPSPDGLKIPTGPCSAAERADGLEEIEPGRRRDDRARSVGDVVGDLPRLAGARTADPQRHVLDRAVDRQRTDPRHPDRVRAGGDAPAAPPGHGGQGRPPHVRPAQHRPPGRLPQQHPERGHPGVAPVPPGPHLNRRRGRAPCPPGDERPEERPDAG